FFSSRRRHTRLQGDWSSDVCSSDLGHLPMKHFTSIDKLDTGILYILELASSLSVLLLAFGLIASMANVLTKGSVLTDHLWMQQRSEERRVGKECRSGWWRWRYMVKE